MAAWPEGWSTATVRAPSCSSSTGALAGSSIAPIACRTSGITSRNGAKYRAFISLSRPISSRTASYACAVVIRPIRTTFAPTRSACALAALRMKSPSLKK